MSINESKRTNNIIESISGAFGSMLEFMVRNKGILRIILPAIVICIATYMIKDVIGQINLGNTADMSPVQIIERIGRNLVKILAFVGSMLPSGYSIMLGVMLLSEELSTEYNTYEKSMYKKKYVIHYMAGVIILAAATSYHLLIS